MHKRIAPPFISYLWYYAHQSRRLADRTTDTIRVKKARISYRIAKTPRTAWLHYLLLLPGIYVVCTYKFPSFVTGLLLALAVGFLSILLPGLYSYFRTTFEFMPEEA